MSLFITLSTLLIPSRSDARPPSATANEPNASDADAEPSERLSPPRLVAGREPVRPSPGTDPVTIELEITIDEAGRVVDPKIVAGDGGAFDAAALDCISQYHFEPARLEGTVTPVRIRYRLVFAPVPEPRESDQQAAPRPASDAAPKGEPAAAPKPALPPEDDAATSSPDPEIVYGATAEVEAPPREPTRRTVSTKKLARVAGTQGDAIRAIEILPGVGRAPLGTDPILRGAAGFESKVFFDSSPVPLLYHFGGLKSFVSSHLLERVDLYPGNFSVRYGRLAGGVIDVRSRPLATDRFGGILELSLLDSSVFVESPVAKHASVGIAARRSNIDFVFDKLVPDDAFDVVAAPIYWDYQALSDVRIAGNHTLRLKAFGSRDSLAFFFEEPDEVDPALRGDLDGAIEFHKLQGNLESRLSEHIRHEAVVSVGTQKASFVLGPESRSGYRTLDVDGRSEWTFDATDSVSVTAGLDVQAQLFEGDYTGGAPPQSEGQPQAGRLGTERTVSLADSFWLVSPAAYVELSYWPTDRVQLVPGVRADYYEVLGAWTLDPRLGARQRIGENTTLKSGVGLFSQPPLYYEGLPVIGNPDLEPYHALHGTLGVEQKLGRNAQLGVEGFAKRLFNRVVSTENGVAPYFENDGSGRIYGVELSGEFRPTNQSFAYLSYTLSKSERQDRNEPWRLFDYDQTHVLSVAASHAWGRGWETSARFRYVSGNPETPVTGSAYDAGSDLYVPLYGPTNSTRTDAFHQLDLRVEKLWTIGRGGIAVYLELINTYNSANPEGTDYSYDYSKSEPVNGFPIFPNLGIRGQL